MPYKDPKARKENSARHYRENKHLWKNADGTWKQGDRERRKQQRRERYNADAAFRAAHNAGAKRRRDKKRVKGKCPICGKEPKKYGSIEAGQLVRDHCHKTGVTRGWICINCNLALGHAMDSPEILRALAMYLERKTTVPTAAEL